MKVLVINCGSSSLKYQLIDMPSGDVAAKGLCERIGIDGVLKHTKGERRIEKQIDMPDHKVAIQEVINALVNEDYGVIESMADIGAVGHRVVHGGEKFTRSVIIDADVIKGIEDCVDLAPLHNPPNIMGIDACRKVMPNTPMVAVFDTAFHQTMPKEAFMYALPYEMYEKYGVRRYGFHGTSHKFVSERCAEIMNKPLEELKIITCHLGNGSSCTAIKGGKSVDTSMGLTPLEGMPMGTRSGVIDPAIVTFLMEKEGLDVKGINDMLNKKSGVYGISGVSSDFRDLHDAADKGNERAELAIDMFCYGVKKYIGSYMAAMGGADAIVFTAGVGENNIIAREKILEGMETMGIKLDVEKNNVKGKETEISTPDSDIKVYVIPTNEELAIAKETYSLTQI